MISRRTEIGSSKKTINPDTNQGGTRRYSVDRRSKLR